MPTYAELEHAAKEEEARIMDAAIPPGEATSQKQKKVQESFDKYTRTVSAMAKKKEKAKSNADFQLAGAVFSVVVMAYSLWTERNILCIVSYFIFFMPIAFEYYFIGDYLPKIKCFVYVGFMLSISMLFMHLTAPLSRTWIFIGGILCMIFSLGEVLAKVSSRQYFLHRI